MKVSDTCFFIFLSSLSQTCVLIKFNGVELPERTGPFLIHVSVAPSYICEQF